jgi:hypothetical protein
VHFTWQSLIQRQTEVVASVDIGAVAGYLARGVDVGWWGSRLADEVCRDRHVKSKLFGGSLRALSRTRLSLLVWLSLFLVRPRLLPVAIRAARFTSFFGVTSTDLLTLPFRRTDLTLVTRTGWLVLCQYR